MEKLSMILYDMLQTGGVFAPLGFIILHLLRQFLFLPVGFICIIGGVLFGAVFGTFYSVIGITLTSFFFYAVFQRMPKVFQKVLALKEKMLGRTTTFSVGQMAILRLIPFIHFHLISICLIEMTSNVKEYTKASFVANVPLAVVYTAFGNWIGSLNVQWMALILFGLLILFYLLRKKELIIPWEDFFAMRSTRA
jgi:uncharacterized membrane protein YdjX (TVP38/TMEM64 family)